MFQAATFLAFAQQYRIRKQSGIFLLAEKNDMKS